MASIVLCANDEPDSLPVWQTRWVTPICIPRLRRLATVLVRVVAVAAIGLVACLPAGAVQALDRQATTVDDERPTIGLSPPREIVELLPGQTAIRQVHLANHTRRTFRAQVDAVDIAAAPGSNSFAVRKPGAARGAGRWLKPEVSTVTAASGERVTIDVVIRVPANATPGAWAAVVAFTEQLDAGDDSGDFRLSPRAGLASQFVIEVPGDARSAGRLSELGSPRLVWHHERPRFSALLQNTGETLLQAEGELEIGAFLNTASQELEVTAAPVLPGGQRRVEVVWKELPWLGWFTPELRLGDGELELRAVYPRIFVLPPWWLIASFTAAILLPLAVRRHQRRRAWRAFADDDGSGEDDDGEWSDRHRDDGR